MQREAAIAFVGLGCGIAQTGSMLYDLHCGGGIRSNCRRMEAGETERSGG